jgi:O-antigen/teichoic acid export membrane protein
MAARFITIAYVNKDYKRANLYYNSVFWGNLIIVAVLLVPAIFFIGKLDSFVDVPAGILPDVKILFALVFCAFFLQTAAPNWDCGTHVTNRLDRAYIPNMVTALLRCGLLIGLFWFFPPHVWYVSLVSLVATMIALGVGYFNTRSLTPELKIRLRKPVCSARMIGELLGSGIWSSIAIAGNTLLIGLDLLICNLFLGPTPMGILSLAKILPNVVVQFTESLRGAFGPQLLIKYAKGDLEGVLASIKKSMKLMCVLVSVVVAGVIVLCDEFYALWIPSQNAQLLQTLTFLSVMSYITDSGIYVLGNVFPTTNRVKYNSAALILTGGISIMITLVLVAFTDWDLYAVAGVSSAVTIIRSLVFTVPVAAKLLGFKWYTFYPQVGLSVLSTILVILIACCVQAVIPTGSWSTFFLAAAIVAVLGLAASMLIVLNKDERSQLLASVKRKLLRKS